MANRNDPPSPVPGPDIGGKLRLALERLASGYYNRLEVLRMVARKVLQLEDDKLR